MAVKGIPLWQQKAAEARAHRDASLAKVEPPLKGVPAAEQLPNNSLELVPHVLTPREIEITESYTVTELLQVLRERKISVEEVTRAFLRRAALAQATVCFAKSKVYTRIMLWKLTTGETPDKLRY